MAQTREKYGTFEQPAISAVSQRAPMRGEILAITVTTASKRFAVPDAWKGSYVRLQADGGDLYMQVSTGTDAAADKTARAQEAAAGGTITLTPSASGNGCYRIPADAWIDVPFPSNAATFALQGSSDCCARAHLSET